MESRLDDELRDDLMAECDDRLEYLEAELLKLSDPTRCDRSAATESVARHLHRVKATAGYIGNEPLRRLSHCAERVLTKVRTGRQPLPDSVIDALLVSVDGLRDALHQQHAASERVIEARLTELLGEDTDRLPKPGPKPEPLRSLVIEDEYTSRLILEQYLGRLGECSQACNGQDGYDKFVDAMTAGRPYHLICLDIRMPVLDGHETLHAIRKLEQNQGILSTAGVKIFMTTSVTEMRSVFKAFGELCDAYLFKPIDTRVLQDHIDCFCPAASTGFQKA